MEIRNNTQTQLNFGMAFIKPDDMGSFTEYVTKKRNASIVKRGIEQLRREQKNNKHFDILYTPQDEILLKPKTIDGEAVATVLTYKKDMGGRQTPIQVIQDSIKHDIDAAEKSGSKFKMFKAMTSSLLKYLKIKIIKAVNPKYSLPKNLVFAADDATMLEKAAESRIKRNALIEQAFKD